jgi:hypothetical protein
MNSTPRNDWLRNAILDGLTKLMTLSLDRQPAADVIVGTAGTWLEAITHARSWDQQRDLPHIRAAFVMLAGHCVEWPKPRQFLDALPPEDRPYHRAPQVAYEKPVKRVITPETAEVIDNLRARLRIVE